MGTVMSFNPRENRSSNSNIQEDAILCSTTSQMEVLNNQTRVSVVNDQSADIDLQSEKNFRKTVFINSLSWKRFSSSASQKKKLDVQNSTISNRVSALRTPLDNVHPSILLDSNKNIQKPCFTLKSNEYFEPVLYTKTSVRQPLQLTVSQSIASRNFEKNHLAQQQQLNVKHSLTENKNHKNQIIVQNKNISNIKSHKKTVVQASTSELLRCLARTPFYLKKIINILIFFFFLGCIPL
jgi:cyclin-dependent kinase 5 activator 1